MLKKSDYYVSTRPKRQQLYKLYKLIINKSAFRPFKDYFEYLKNRTQAKLR